MNANLENLKYAYIEFFVGMAKMVTYWHVKALGFELKAYRGPETGNAEQLSYLLTKGSINLVITSAAKPSSFEILSFVDRHGNGVKRIAYHVDNVHEAYETAISRGAIPAVGPQRLEDEQGYVEEASIRLLDLKELVFVDDSHYNGCFIPGFAPHAIPGFEPSFDNGFQYLDHIAYGLHVNEMKFWCNDYFKKIFGGEVVQDIKKGDIISEHSGLLLRLLSSGEHLHNVFVEPQNREHPSQVQEYIEAYYGSGIQHMAFATDNIFETVEHMRRSGVDFVGYPDSYYDILLEEGRIPADVVKKSRQFNVLCDGVDGAYLFQTFTKPFGDRPTFFYEIIQRTNGYRGFALENISQLFRAVQREQIKRS